jgi:hypothetical protein
MEKFIVLGGMGPTGNDLSFGGRGVIEGSERDLGPPHY